MCPCVEGGFADHFLVDFVDAEFVGCLCGLVELLSDAYDGVSLIRVAEVGKLLVVAALERP